MNKPKRRFGDRYDGYRIRGIDPLCQIIPSVMRTRLDSMVYFNEELEITQLEKFVREQRRNGLPNLRMLHIFMAAMVRVMSQRPQLNRFVVGRKIFAHNDMRISLACKRELSLDGEETTIMPSFEPEDALADVVNKVETCIQEEVLTSETDNGATYAVARLLGAIPTFVKARVIDFIRALDRIGWMPRIINRASPFHSSMFITDLGSCGISPVFHHLYEFGTCSVFVAIGKKETRYELDANGQVQTRRYIEMKVVADERICDGFYYASSMRLLSRLIQHPERLLTPPEEIVEDTAIYRPSRKAAPAPVAPPVEREKEPVAAE